MRCFMHCLCSRSQRIVFGVLLGKGDSDGCVGGSGGGGGGGGGGVCGGEGGGRMNK